MQWQHPWCGKCAVHETTLANRQDIVTHVVQHTKSSQVMMDSGAVYVSSCHPSKPATVALGLRCYAAESKDAGSNPAVVTASQTEAKSENAGMSRFGPPEHSTMACFIAQV